jgi:hypothetical protein
LERKALPESEQRKEAKIAKTAQAKSLCTANGQFARTVREFFLVGAEGRAKVFVPLRCLPPTWRFATGKGRRPRQIGGTANSASCEPDGRNKV